jgi:hypothetical protein
MRIDNESSEGTNLSSCTVADATVTMKSPMSKTDSRKKHNRTRKIVSNNENLYLSTSAKVSESSEDTQSESKLQQIPKKIQLKVPWRFVNNLQGNGGWPEMF